MKKYYLRWQTLLFVALMCLGLSACGGDDDGDGRASSELSVDLAQLNFSADGQSQTFRITSNTDWTITGIPNWLTINPTSGSNNKNIVVMATENTSVSSRTCQLRITTDDGQATEVISVEQAAKSEDISVDVTEINLDGKANSSSLLRITCNTAWTISGTPSWLTLSSVNGNGTTQITITANSDNNSATPRECTLSVMAGQVTQQVKIKQNALLTANCDVMPKTIVALANGFAFDYTYGSNVAYYHVKLYLPNEIERLTDEEIITKMSEDIEDRDTPNDGYVTSWRNLSPLTEYTVCIVGFDKNGNHGELQKRNLKTKSNTNQAIATISDVKYSDTNWEWTTTTNGFVTRYYQWFVTRSSLHNSTDAAIAWFFNDAMKKSPDDFPAIAQGDTWVRSRDGGYIFDVVTWAVDVNGEFAGVIDRFVGQVESSSSKVQKIKVSPKDNPFKYYKTKK